MSAFVCAVHGVSNESKLGVLNLRYSPGTTCVRYFVSQIVSDLFGYFIHNPDPKVIFAVDSGCKNTSPCHNFLSFLQANSETKKCSCRTLDG